MRFCSFVDGWTEQIMSQSNRCVLRVSQGILRVALWLTIAILFANCRTPPPEQKWKLPMGEQAVMCTVDDEDAGLANQHATVSERDGAHGRSLPTVPEECSHASVKPSPDNETYSAHVKDGFYNRSGTCGVFRVLGMMGSSLYFYNEDGAFVAFVRIRDYWGEPCNGYEYYGEVPTDCSLEMSTVDGILGI